MDKYFVKTPYLPKGKISLYVGDVALPRAQCIKPFYDARLPKALSMHADLTFCYLGEGTAVCAKEAFSYYSRAFSETELCLIEGASFLDMHYPKDSAYNIAVVGNKIFCKTKITDRVLLNKAEALGYKIVDINQGYAKCSVCPVSENAAISADPSFLKAAEKEGIDCLKITNDSITLPGYDTGFFGGAAFMKDEKTLAVNGNIMLHPDAKRIKDFLSGYNISVLSLKCDEISDFGSLIAICE